jgi:hypothetical protein
MGSSVEVFKEFEYDMALNYFMGFIADIEEKIPSRRILAYCPFCGTRLPNFSEEYFDTIEQELGKNSIPKGCDAEARRHLPQEFKTDEWWKKRGITKGYLSEIYDPIRFEENIEIINGERVLKV